MGTDIRKVVNANLESPRQVAQRIANRAVVLFEVPPTARVPAAENHVHRPARADRALEFATVAPDGATVFGARKLAPQLTREKRRLHGNECSTFGVVGQCLLENRINHLPAVVARFRGLPNRFRLRAASVTRPDRPLRAGAPPALASQSKTWLVVLRDVFTVNFGTRTARENRPPASRNARRRSWYAESCQVNFGELWG